MTTDASARIRPVLHSDTQTLILLFFSCVTAGYGIGTFFGKLGAFLLQQNRSQWGDFGGIAGGLIGIGVYIGVVIDIVST